MYYLKTQFITFITNEYNNDCYDNNETNNTTFYTIAFMRALIDHINVY